MAARGGWEGPLQDLWFQRMLPRGPHSQPDPSYHFIKNSYAYKMISLYTYILFQILFHYRLLRDTK